VPADFADRVRDDGAILFEHDASIGSVWKALPARVRGDILRRKLHLFTAKGYEVPPSAGGTVEPLDAATQREERMLGAVLGALNALGVAEINPRKLLAARRKLFEDAPEAESDARVRELQAGFDVVARVETTGLPTPTAGESVVLEAQPPASVRSAGRAEETVDSLTRFWDHVGVPEREGSGGDFHPDPYFATGTLPALSSSFHDVSRGRRMLPAFDAARCTGCGACWSGCPDSALAAGVWSPAVFVERGMALVARSGRSAEGLRMMLGKFAARVGEELAASATAGIGAGALLDTAFAQVTSKMTLTEDRRKGAVDAFGAVRDAVGVLPVTRTQVFFEEPEAAAKGSGELFSLAINPDACKGCGLCVTVCEPEALTRAPEDAARAAASRNGWRLLHELPEPAEAACARAREHADVGPLAAAMLRREANLAMIGGDGAEAGSGEKIALRQVLGIALDALALSAGEYVAEIEDLRAKLSEAVREGLASALPTSDLNALAEGLDAVGRPDTDLAALTARVETAFETGRVDVVRMRRLVDVARDLADLHQRLTVGATGAGVAKFGLVLAPSADAGWVGAFPNNPFGVPVTLRGEADGLALARGVLEGQLRQALDGLRTVRRARLEVERPSEAAVAAESLARLTWRDLTPAERRVCPPLFFVADETALAGDAMAGFAELLNDDLPVKAVLLAETSFRRELGTSLRSGDRGPKPTPAAPELGLLALAGSRAMVVQSSIAHARHMAAGVAAAVLHDGPAVVRVYAPSPERHGFAPERTLERAQGAVLSRTCPLFTAAHDPVGGAPLHVSVDGNPDPTAIWCADADGNAVTPASWARGERRLAGHLSPVAGNASEPTPLAEYLALSAEDREDKTPVVTGSDGTFQVDSALVSAAGERLAAWRTLQALAGAGSPRAESAAVDAGVLAATELDHAAAVDALRQDYEARLANQQHQLKAELARQVRAKLLAIVARSAGNGGDPI
jgi:pyruvate-ferredoxin/flavodoxin oxidoreductase